MSDDGGADFGGVIQNLDAIDIVGAYRSASLGDYFVAAGRIRVHVRIDDIAQRLVRNLADRRENLVAAGAI